jgi:hypothetical protein
VPRFTSPRLTSHFDTNFVRQLRRGRCLVTEFGGASLQSRIITNWGGKAVYKFCIHFVRWITQCLVTV